MTAVTGPPAETPVPWEYPTGVWALLPWAGRPMTTVVSSSSAGVAIQVRRDSQLHIGDFMHHLQGRAIVPELSYRDTQL